MNAHLYLRASTKDQDAQRALSLLEKFVGDNGLTVAGVYSENISGTRLDRPELTKLLSTAGSGDVLLVESVDRLSRLSLPDWQKLKNTIQSKGLKLVVVDLPTSHQILDSGITGAVMQVINDMLIDLMATMARLDQEKRVERIKQGIERKKQIDPEWKASGKKRDVAKWEQIKSYLAKGGNTVEEVAKLCDVGVATVYRVKREL